MAGMFDTSERRRVTQNAAARSRRQERVALNPHLVRQEEREARLRKKIGDPIGYAERQLRRNCNNHGLTVDEFDAMIWLQDNKCIGCGVADPNHIDHDHNCCPGATNCRKCSRGVLCGECNRGLGLLYDKVETLKNLTVYLECG